MGEDLVIVYTSAFQAEETIQRAIDSVRRQTYRNWLWFLVSNGSMDRTARIIMNAALEDCRIIPVGLKNNIRYLGLKLRPRLKQLYPDQFFMQLDADDELAPQCMEELLHFMKESDLDIAACGTEFRKEEADDETNHIDIRCLDEKLIISGDEFVNKFYLFRPYTNEIWAKMYRFSVIGSCGFHSEFPNDSLTIFRWFCEANRIGVLPEVLHKSYLKSGSSRHEDYGNHTIDKAKRIYQHEYRISWESINEAILEYQAGLSRFGELSERNREYLYSIYVGWIHQNMIQLCMAAPMENSNGCYKNLRDMICSEVFQQIFTYRQRLEEYRNLTQRSAILRQLYSFICVSAELAAEPELTYPIKEQIEELIVKLKGEKNAVYGI